MTYQTQPGTIPHRVVNWLRTQPAGAEFAGIVIAEELGIDPKYIVPCLTTPKKHGVIAGRKVDGVWLWSLGDGTPEPLPEDHEPEEPLVAEPQQAERKKPGPRPKQNAAAPLQITVKPDTGHFRVGYFSDGTFVIERSSEQITLTRDQSKILAAFIVSGDK